MADPKPTIASGNREEDEREGRRLVEREEEGLEPEKHPGPRQNEGISSAGRLYATQEEADAASPTEKGVERTHVDRKAAHVFGEGGEDE
ncbi:MAG: hypothetical protein WBV82_11430 [Myxococcaceae bacterium]